MQRRVATPRAGRSAAKPSPNARTARASSRSPAASGAIFPMVGPGPLDYAGRPEKPMRRGNPRPPGGSCARTDRNARGIRPRPGLGRSLARSHEGKRANRCSIRSGRDAAHRGDHAGGQPDPDRPGERQDRPCGAWKRLALRTRPRARLRSAPGRERGAALGSQPEGRDRSHAGDAPHGIRHAHRRQPHHDREQYRSRMLDPLRKHPEARRRDGISAYFWGSDIRGVAYLHRVRAARAAVRRFSES